MTDGLAVSSTTRGPYGYTNVEEALMRVLCSGDRSRVPFVVVSPSSVPLLLFYQYDGRTYIERPLNKSIERPI